MDGITMLADTSGASRIPDTRSARATGSLRRHQGSFRRISRKGQSRPARRPTTSTCWNSLRPPGAAGRSTEHCTADAACGHMWGYPRVRSRARLRECVTCVVRPSRLCTPPGPSTGLPARGLGGHSPSRCTQWQICTLSRARSAMPPLPMLSADSYFMQKQPTEQACTHERDDKYNADGVVTKNVRICLLHDAQHACEFRTAHHGTRPYEATWREARARL